MANRQDPHAVLGLDQSAGADDVRRAYFRLVRQYPPETHPEEFKRIRAAYEILRSPLRRIEVALTAFDEAAAEVNISLLERSAGPVALDIAAALLAVELSISDLARSDFPEDLTRIREEDLVGS